MQRLRLNEFAKRVSELSRDLKTSVNFCKAARSKLLESEKEVRKRLEVVHLVCRVHF